MSRKTHIKREKNGEEREREGECKGREGTKRERVSEEGREGGTLESQLVVVVFQK